VRSVWCPKASVHIHGLPTGAALALKTRPDGPASARGARAQCRIGKAITGRELATACDDGLGNLRRTDEGVGALARERAYSLAPPALSECGHCGLARLGIAVCVPTGAALALKMGPTNLHLRSIQQLHHHEYGRGRENSEHRANEQRFGCLLHAIGSLTHARLYLLLLLHRFVPSAGVVGIVRFTPIGSNVRRRMKHVMRAALKPLLGAMRYFPRARRRGLKVRATSRA
jgi:hypothetical protein